MGLHDLLGLKEPYPEAVALGRVERKKQLRFHELRRHSAPVVFDSQLHRAVVAAGSQDNRAILGYRLARIDDEILDHPRYFLPVNQYGRDVRQVLDQP